MELTVRSSDSVDDLKAARELLDKLIASKGGQNPQSEQSIPSMGMFDDQPKQEHQNSTQVEFYR